MTLRHVRHRIGASALALSLSSAALAGDDFRGTWRGTWPDGQTTELTVVRIDDDGRAYGAYCHRSSRATQHFLLDLHPTEGIGSSRDDDTLRFAFEGGTWAFRVDRADPDVIAMAFRRTQTRELDMARVDEQTCASRLVQLTPPPGAPVRPTVAEALPDEPRHWAIGAWTVTGPAGRQAELTLFDMVNRRGHGLYCVLRDGPSYNVFDVHPDGLNVKVTRNKLSFQIRKVRFAFKRTDDPDVLEATRRHKGKKTTAEAHRANEPACASRIAAR